MRISLASACAVLLACAGAQGPDSVRVERYRLSQSGADWTRAGDDRVLDDLRPRHPDFFARVFDEKASDDIDLRALRDDLERAPVDRLNYDALNALAIAYFELNARAEALRGSGNTAYLGGSMQVAKLAGVPWRAYREIQEPALRGAILDFFADAAGGEKPGTARTNARLASIVDSLAKHEQDPSRQTRIREIVQRLAASAVR
jgi:hypothetical protein